MRRLDREDLGVPGRLLVLLRLRVPSVQVFLRPLAGLEVQLGPADLVDQNKMQAQGSAWQPRGTWLSSALPPLCLRTTKSLGRVSGFPVRKHGSIIKDFAISAQSRPAALTSDVCSASKLPASALEMRGRRNTRQIFRCDLRASHAPNIQCFRRLGRNERLRSNRVRLSG